MDALVAETERLEAAADDALERFERLRNGDGVAPGPLEDENAKLRHRLAVLRDACATEAGVAVSLLDHLTATFARAIADAYPDLEEPPVAIAASTKFGDYQCNSAMPISQALKAKGKPANPREIAANIVAHAKPSTAIERLEVAGAGFVNVFVRRSFAEHALADHLRRGVAPPKLAKRERCVVDFSSPNIAKEMHVGHLRSTIIGDSVCRLLEFMGHDVVGFNHVGDWGTQFGMLIAHLQDRYPDYTVNSPPISDLQAFYKESKKRFDDDAEFKKRAYACVVKLQAFDPDYAKAWHLICDVSRKEFQKVYDRLGVNIVERGESFYHKLMDSMVEDLKARKLLEDDDGRQIMWGEGVSVPLTIVKSDGGYTYDTSDLACIKQRIEDERGDRIVYVTDAGQSVHFQGIEACARKAGYLTTQSMEHVGFGVVLGEDRKKFKTRSGDTVRLVELLDEGLKRALDTLIEKGRDKVLTPDELRAAQEAVAYGCIKYADLSHNRTHEYVFSFDKMLEDKGNTAVYLLYAYTRIKSIARNAQLTPEQIKRISETVYPATKHEREWKLAKILVRFPEMLQKVSKDLCLHNLCEYLYDICTSFNEFYDVCYCVEKDSSGNIVKVNYERILLCEVTAMIMEVCFKILGLNPVSKM